MVQKSLAGRRQLNAMSAASDQLNADFLFEIPDLPAEGGLRRMELLLGANGQTACISHRDDIAGMPELHHKLPNLVGPSLASPSLASPSLASPSLASPSLASPSLANPSLASPCLVSMGPAYKVFFKPASRLYSRKALHTGPA